LRREVEGMNFFRGGLMLVAAGIALWKGWAIHRGPYAWMAFGLGAAALGLAAWHFTRKSERERS